MIGCGSKTHTVRFMNGDTVLYEYKLKNDDSFTAPSDVEIEGYEFLGWFKDSKLTTPFTFENLVVDKDINIYGKFEKKSYNIEFANGVQGYKVLNQVASVSYGEDYSFDIIVYKDYTQSLPLVSTSLSNTNLQHTAKEDILEGEFAGGIKYTYKIENIKQNLKITISDLTHTNTYSISIPQNQVGYTLTSNKTSISYGESVTLNFSLLELYDKSNYKVIVNGNEIEISNGGSYLIKNIAENIEIKVQGVEKNSFKIDVELATETYSIKDIQGAYIENGVLKARVGSTAKFKIQPSEEYSLSEVKINCTINGVTKYGIKGTNNTFEFQNIDSDIKIEVTGIVKNKYDITLPADQYGFSLIATGNTGKTIEHGGEATFVFKKQLGFKYDNASLSYTVNGKTNVIRLSEKGDSFSLSVKDIQTHLIFTVSGVEENFKSITFENNEKFEIVDVQNCFESRVQDDVILKKVYSSLDYKFKVEFKEGFEAKAGFSAVLSNEDNSQVRITPEDGVFTITNVSNEYSVKIENYGIIMLAISENINNCLGCGFEFAEEYANNGIEYGKTIDVKFKVGSDYTTWLGGSEFNFDAGNGNEISNIIPNKDDLSVSFKVLVKSNVNLRVLNIEKNKINITSIVEDCTIAEGTYPIKLILNGETTAISQAYVNSTINLKLQIQYGYEVEVENNTSKLSVTCNGEVIKPLNSTVENGLITYNLSSVAVGTSNLHFIVSGIKIKEFVVKIASVDEMFEMKTNIPTTSEEYTKNKIANLVYLSNFEFEVVLNEKYSNSNYRINVVDSDNNNLLYTLSKSDLENGKYSITIDHNTYLCVEYSSLAINQYTVSYSVVNKDSEGNIISTKKADTVRVSHGDSILNGIAKVEIDGEIIEKQIFINGIGSGLNIDGIEIINIVAKNGEVDYNKITTDCELEFIFEYKTFSVWLAYIKDDQSVTELKISYDELVDENGNNIKYTLPTPSQKPHHDFVFSNWCLIVQKENQTAENNEEEIEFEKRIITEISYDMVKNESIQLELYADWIIPPPEITNTIDDGKEQILVVVDNPDLCEFAWVIVQTTTENGEEKEIEIEIEQTNGEGKALLYSDVKKTLEKMNETGESVSGTYKVRCHLYNIFGVSLSEETIHNFSITI